MRTRSTRRVPSFLAAGAGLILLLGGRLAAQPMPREMAAEKEAWKDFQYQKAERCSQCHTEGNPRYYPDAEGKALRAMDIALMTEYAIWKTHDKHAQAYAVLK